MEQAVKRVTLEIFKPKTGSLIVSIVFCSICLFLWVFIWHANANLVLEQRDLIEDNFPPERNVVRGNVNDRAVAPKPPAPLPINLPPAAPPKPKPEVVTKNAQLTDLRNKIGNAQKVL